MAGVYQGIYKKTYLAPQIVLGTAATAGGQELRRITSVATEKKTAIQNNEISSIGMDLGSATGASSTDWQFDGLLSPGTYSLPIAACLRDDFTATAASTGVAATIAGTGASGGTITITDAANNFLVDGFKVGDVVRITAGAVAAANLNNNLWLTGVTDTVLTGVLLNTPEEGGTAYVAEGPIAAVTIASVGKRCVPSATVKTDKIFTLEELYSDNAGSPTYISEVFKDIRIGQVDFTFPPNATATIKWTGVGLGSRVIGSATTMVTPAAISSSNVVSATRGAMVAGGNVLNYVTNINVTINPQVAALGAVIGSKNSPDHSKGKILVSGSFSAYQMDSTLMSSFSTDTPISLLVAMTSDTTKNSEFVAFTLSRVRLTGDAATDGEQGVTRTYPFTAEYNSAGGAALANDATIITVQDSLAA